MIFSLWTSRRLALVVGEVCRANIPKASYAGKELCTIALPASDASTSIILPILVMENPRCYVNSIVKLLVIGIVKFALGPSHQKIHRIL